MECLKDLLSVFVCVCEYARVCWYTHTIVYGLHHTCGGGRLAGMGPRHQTQVARLCGKHFFPLRCLASLGYPLVACGASVSLCGAGSRRVLALPPHHLLDSGGAFDVSPMSFPVNFSNTCHYSGDSSFCSQCLMIF